MIVLLIVTFIVIGGVFFYKLNLQKNEVEKIKKIEMLIETEKTPEKTDLADYENVINKLKDISKKAAGLYLVAEYYFRKMDKSETELKKLKDTYIELTEQYPQFEKRDNVLFKLGNVYFFNYFNFMESIKFYEQLSRECPSSKWIKVANTRLKLIKSAYPNEEPVLKEYALAEKFFEIREFDKTIEQLKSITTTHQTSKLAGDACYFLGDIFFFKKSDYNTALNYYSQLINKYPLHRHVGNAQFKMGETYRKLQKLSEAIIAYKKFLENYNDFRYTDYAQYYIAECHEKLKDWVLALRTYKLLVANYSESIWVGIALSKIKNLEKLIK
ncbi:MAG: tetratricopeptide repeat protein [Elusimicrobiota bacterium]